MNAPQAIQALINSLRTWYLCENDSVLSFDFSIRKRKQNKVIELTNAFGQEKKKKEKERKIWLKTLLT